MKPRKHQRPANPDQRARRPAKARRQPDSNAQHADPWPPDPFVEGCWLDDGERPPPWPGRTVVGELVSGWAVRAAVAAYDRAADGAAERTDPRAQMRAALLAAAPNIAAAALFRWAVFFGQLACGFEEMAKQEEVEDGQTPNYRALTTSATVMQAAFQNLDRHGHRLAPEELGRQPDSHR